MKLLHTIRSGTTNWTQFSDRANVRPQQHDFTSHTLTLVN